MKNNAKKLDQNIPQKERKNRKMTEKIIPQEQIDKSEHKSFPPHWTPRFISNT